MSYSLNILDSWARNDGRFFHLRMKKKLIRTSRKDKIKRIYGIDG